MFFNVLDEIVTWQRLQPPVASLSGGFSGAVLGVRALSFVIVPMTPVRHSSFRKSDIDQVSITTDNAECIFT